MNDTAQNSSFGLSLNHIIWTIGRRKGAIAVSTLLGLVAAQLFLTFVPPKYVASSQLLFNAAAEQFVSSDQELRTSYGAHQIFESATAMIESPGILKPVALKIMSQTPEQLSSMPAMQKILALPDLSEGERLSALIEGIQKSLTIKIQAADQVIVLEYKSKSPAEAASIANLVAATFIEERAASRKASLVQATEWLDERSAEAKSRLMEIDKKIQDFKAKHRIEDLTGSSALEAELAHARDQLATLQTRLAEAETVYETLHTYADGGEEDYERLAESIGGAGLDRLRSSLADAQGALASAKSRLGTFHPAVKAEEGHVAAIRAEIAAEARRKQLTSKIDMDQLVARQQTLREEVKSLESKVRDLRASEVQLLEFQREREATKTLYDTMLAKGMQANLQQTLNFAQFKILLDATIPKRPKLPPALVWSAGAIAGLAFGFIVSLLWELFHGRLVILDQARKQLPVAVITQVPEITKADFNGASAMGVLNYRNFAKEFPNSLFTNKLLAAQLAVNAISADGLCKVAMITSPMQGDGKTHISSNLASLSVLLGKRTLFIDLDARKNNDDGDVSEGSACSELTAFVKENKLDEVFSATRRIGGYDILRVISSNGTACFNIFQTKTLDIIAFARANYDYVWIDTPPVGIFNDPLIIARQVDGVLVVGGWSKTTIRQLKDAIELIQENGGCVLGVIINGVRVDALISESMASYANYYGDSKHSSRSRRI
jgi:polysaccharide biosynthesis transport protein